MAMSSTTTGSSSLATAFQVPVATMVGRQRHSTTSVLRMKENVNNNDDPVDIDNPTTMDRRSFFTASAAASLLWTQFPHAAMAGGLVQFPCDRPLKNRYHFMRAGLSELEEEHLWCTNPLFMTNRENALAASAQKSVLEACEAIKASGHLPTVAYHSLAANGIDTADLIGQQLRLGRDRILPEFTYLDPRGVGLWDSNDEMEIKPAVWAMDVYEAGKEGTGGRPPANTDGTPNETLADQFVRLRQFLSLQESRTSGENILLIFPDGTGPALLSAMIAGIPLSQTHVLEYAPAEVRLDITRESILASYAAKKNDETYLATIERGKEQLAALRKLKREDMVSLKDQRLELERQALEENFLRVKAKERQREQQLLAAKANAKQQKQSTTTTPQGGEDGTTAFDAAALPTRRPVAKAPMDEIDFMDGSKVTALFGMGVVGAGLAAVTGVLGGGGGKDDDKSVVTTTASNVIVGRNGTVALSPPTRMQSATLSRPSPTTPLSRPSSTPRSEQSANTARSGDATTQQENEIVANDNNTVDDELKQLEEAQLAMDSLLMENADSATNSDYDNDDPIAKELGELEAAQKAMDDYLNMDDGASDWLQVLAEIRNEPEEDAAAADDDNAKINGEK